MKTNQLKLSTFDHLIQQKKSVASYLNEEKDPLRLNPLVDGEATSKIFETILKFLPVESREKINTVAQTDSEIEVDSKKALKVTVLYAIEDETVARISQIANDVLETSDSSQVFLELTLTWLQNEKIDKALKFAEEIKDLEKQAKAFSEIVTAFCSLRKLHDAAIYMDRIREPFHSLKPFEAVALALSSSGKWDQADKYVDQILVPSSRFRVLNTMALHALRYGRMDLAFGYAEQITNDSNRFQTYSELALALNRGRKKIDQIMVVINKITNPRIQRSTIGRIVADLADLGNFKYVDECLQKTQTEEKRSEVISSAVLCLINEKTGNPQEAPTKPKFINRFKEIFESDQVQMLKDADRLEQALKLANLERNSEQQLNMICSIVLNFIAKKHFERGVEIVQKFVDPSDQDRVLLGVVKELDKTNRLDEAARLVAKIQDSDTKLEVFENIANIIKSPDHFSWLGSFIESLESDNHRGIALTDIGIILVKDQDSELTCMLIEEYLEEDHDLQEVVFTNIAAQLVEEGDGTLADDLIEKIEDEEIQDAVRTNLNEFIQTNQVLQVMERALELIQRGEEEEVDRLLESISNLQVKEQVFKNLHRSSS